MMPFVQPICYHVMHVVIKKVLCKCVCLKAAVFLCCFSLCTVFFLKFIIPSGNHHKLTARGPHFGEKIVKWNTSIIRDFSRGTPNCDQESLLLLMITSSPEHFERRQAIRNTWCNTDWIAEAERKWLCIFLIGKTHHSEWHASIQKEFQVYHDILLGSYTDSYRNLTIKVLHGLSWIYDQCHIDYVLKTDDDCFVNAELLVDFITNSEDTMTNLYVGRAFVETKDREVVRTDGNKWVLSYDMYPDKYYPQYNSGTGYLLSLDVLPKLLAISENVKPFPNEDAYIGVLMNLSNIPVLNSHRFLQQPDGGFQLCNFRYLMLFHNVKPKVQGELYSEAQVAKHRCKSQEMNLKWDG